MYLNINSSPIVNNIDDFFYVSANTAYIISLFYNTYIPIAINLNTGIV